MNFIAFTLAVAGFCALCRGSERYFEKISFACLAPNRLALRVGGWLLLLCSMWASISGNGISIGVSMFFGISALAAGGVMLLSAYTPRILPGTCALAGLCAACGGIYQYIRMY